MIVSIRACIFIVLVWLCFPGLAWGQAQNILNLSPVEAIMAGRPGETVTLDFLVRNKGTQGYLLVCRISDYWHKKNQLTTGPLGTYQTRQAGPWTHCNPNRILIPAGGIQGVTLVSSIPSGSTGDYFATFVVETRSPSEVTEPTSDSDLFVGTKIAASVVVTVLGTQRPQLDLKDPKVIKGPHFLTFQAGIKNSGNIALGGNATLVLLDSEQRSVLKFSVVVSMTLPGMENFLQADIVEKVPPGAYQAVFTLASPNKGSSLLKEFPLTVP